jgi:hypothetical protein
LIDLGIGKYIHVKECKYSRILFRWACRIPWRKHGRIRH